MTEEKSSVKGFGSKLKLEREAREISLEEISRVTKISIHLLHAMEEDNWEALPGGIFTRNFIRLFANHLGLDGERWVDEFKHFIKAKNKAEGVEEEVEKEEHEGSDLPQGMVYGFIGLAAVIIVGGYLLISNFNFGNKDTNQTQNTQESATAEEPVEAQMLEDAPVIEESQPAVEGLVVELKETGNRCWYQWWGDGQLKTPAEGDNLKSNVSVSLQAENVIKLYMAHLQGVEISVNGKAREWAEFKPSPRQDAEGKITGYVVEIKKEQGE